MNTISSGSLERGLGYQEHGGAFATHPELCLAIRELVLKEVTSDAGQDFDSMSKMSEKIRSLAEIVRIKARESFRAVTGVDAGEQQLALSSRRYAVISALAYSLPEGRCFFSDPESVKFSFELSDMRFRSISSVRREAMLYKTGIRFVKENPEVQLILVDGPLAFSNWWKEAGRPVDREVFVDGVNDFLRLCQEQQILVAGIVKRPSARYLLSYLGLENETSLPDSFVLHQVLIDGERTLFFSPRAALRRVFRASPFMESIDFPIYSVYARLSKDWTLPPIRIDLPAFSLGFADEIVEYCYSTSYLQGIPLAVLKADEAVRISKKFVDDIYIEIISRVGRETGQLSCVAPVWGEGRWMTR